MHMYVYISTCLYSLHLTFIIKEIQVEILCLDLGYYAVFIQLMFSMKGFEMTIVRQDLMQLH